MSVVTTGPVYHRELIDGREIEKPLPKKLHFLVQRFLLLLLSRELPSRYLAGPELNILTGGKITDGRREYIVPDLVVIERSARFEDGDLAEPPLWAVEILSPGHTIGDLFIRAERLLKLGCPLVWVIWPEKRKAWEYTPGDLQEAGSTLTASNQIQVPLSQMWADLDL